MPTPTRLALARPAAALLLLAATAARPAIDPGPAGTLVVANQQSADVTLVTLPAGTTRQVAVGAGPHEAAVTADGRWGIVTVYGTREEMGTRLAVVDLATGALVRHVALGTYTRPHGVVALPGEGNRVVVTSEASQRLLVVDLARDSVVAAIATGAPGSHMVAVSRDGRRAYTANIPAGSMSEIDLVEGRLVRQVAVGPVSEGIALSPDGREAWVGSNAARTIAVVDLARGTVTDTLTGVGVPYRLAFSPDGRTVAVADPEGNAVHLLDAATRRPLASVGGLGSPRGVQFAPDGASVFATLGAENAVAVIDVAARAVRGRHAVGAVPDGVAFAPARR